MTLVGHGELLAALGATAGEDLAAVLGGHAGTEAVGLDTLPLVGLIRALHSELLLAEIEPADSRQNSLKILSRPLARVKQTRSTTTGFYRESPDDSIVHAQIEPDVGSTEKHPRHSFAQSPATPGRRARWRLHNGKLS